MADLERDIVDHLAALDEADRQAAFDRINMGLKLKVPADEADPPPPIHTLDEYLTMDLDQPPSLISDCQVLRGELTTTIARAGKGKTTLLTNRMMRWSAGLPLFDDAPDTQAPEGGEPLRCLLIENEGSGYYMRETMQKLFDHVAIDEKHKALARENLMVWGDGGYTGLKVDKDEDLATLERGLTESKPDILFLEPFRGIWTGEENDNTAMEAVLDRLVQLASGFNCAIMISHHANKSPIDDGEFMSAARGATAFEGKVAAMEFFRPVRDGEQRELKWTKKRYGRQHAAPIRMVYDFDTRSLQRVPDSEVEKLVLAKMVADDPPQFWTKAQLAEEIGESAAKIGKALDNLKEQDRVVQRRKEQTQYFKLKTGDEDNKTEGMEF